MRVLHVVMSDCVDKTTKMLQTFFKGVYSNSSTFLTLENLVSVQFYEYEQLQQMLQVSGFRAKLNYDWYANVPPVSRGEENMTCWIQ